jgi:hypothetical protein
VHVPTARSAIASASAFRRSADREARKLVLIFETRRQEGHKVHLRHTPITGEFAHCLALAHIIRKKANQAGAGLFGLGLGMMTPVARLVLHLVFDLLLGGIYGLLGA